MANFMVQTHPDRDQFHSKTKDRIELLKGKICKCGEKRIKSLLLQNNGTISCYNCKKHNKKYNYETSGIMQRNTRLHYDEITALQGYCYNNGCTERRPKTLMVIIFKDKKCLLCRNCEMYNRHRRYEDFDIIIPW